MITRSTRLIMEVYDKKSAPHAHQNIMQWGMRGERGGRVPARRGISRTQDYCGS